MAREIKKPASIRESDTKEFAGDVVIDVSYREPEVKEEQDEAPQSVVINAAAERVAVAAAQAAATLPGVKMLSFNAWFQKVCARNPRVKLSYKEAIQAHCKAVGLDNESTEEAFDAALVNFGL